jgi:hypothetical protein
VSQQRRDLPDDLVIEHKGDNVPVVAGPVLRASGWRGGQWVRYVPPTGVDECEVAVSDGNEVAGVLIFPSEAAAPNEEFGAPLNYTGQQVRTNQGAVAGASVVTMMNGGGRFFYLFYETVALIGAGTRTGAPITYTLNEDLKISENGILCNDSDVNLAAAGVTNPHTVGICCSVPATRNGGRLGLDMKH